MRRVELTQDGNQMEDEPRQKKCSLFQLDGQHEQQIDQDANSGKNAKNYDNEQVEFSLVYFSVMPLIFSLTALLVSIRGGD